MKLPKSFIEKYPKGFKEVDTLLYVRSERKRVGVVIIHNGFCGWSLCDGKDKWDTAKGILKALYRLNQNNSPGEIARMGHRIFAGGLTYRSKLKAREFSFEAMGNMIDRYIA